MQSLIKFKIENKTKKKNSVPVQNIYWTVFISKITQIVCFCRIVPECTDNNVFVMFLCHTIIPSLPSEALLYKFVIKVSLLLPCVIIQNLEMVLQAFPSTIFFSFVVMRGFSVMTSRSEKGLFLWLKRLYPHGPVEFLPSHLVKKAGWKS